MIDYQFNHDEEVDKLCKAVIATMPTWSAGQRVRFIEAIDGVYRIHCGFELKGKPCHYTNDD